MSSEELEKPICYLCHDEETEENKFIDPQPCPCKGQLKLHKLCYEEIRSHNINDCSICKSPYAHFVDGYANINTTLFMVINYEYKLLYKLDTNFKKQGEQKIVEIETNLYNGERTERLIQHITFTDGLMHGVEKTFKPRFLCSRALAFTNQSDFIEREVHYENGKRNGITKSVYRDFVSEIPWVNDTPHGTARYVFTNGQLKKEVIFENGKIMNNITTYRDDGSLEAVEAYSNGERNGKTITYWPNGKIRAEIIYINDVMNELAVHYNVNGIKISQLSYKDGAIDGEYLEFFSDGTVSKRGNYVHNLRQGLFTEYHPNGQVASEYNYTDDRVIGTRIYWDSDGVFVRSEDYVLLEDEDEEDEEYDEPEEEEDEPEEEEDEPEEEEDEPEEDGSVGSERSESPHEEEDTSSE